MDYSRIINKYLPDIELFQGNKPTLLIILGSFGDFDSFEYGQLISRKLEVLQELNINLVAIGIGSQESKIKFSNFTRLPQSFLFNVENNYLHNDLGLEDGYKYDLGPFFNLILMCTGFNSPGTLREVLRGYTGDKSSEAIFLKEETISLLPFFSIETSLFNRLRNNKSLRPFELASQRLINMVEVLSNWNKYVPINKFIVQRGATLLFNETEQLVYSYMPKSLLCFSETMDKPLEFIDSNLRNK